MIEKIKTYAKITNLWAIARRYFVNNFYDGMLTVLGILLGFFFLILESETHSISSRLILFTCLGSSISMFISGSTSSYLSEKAEQRKLKVELYKAMIIHDLEDKEELTIEEIEKAMLMRLKKKRDKKTPLEKKGIDKKKKKNILERAESFTIIIVAFVNGVSPFLGGLMALIPFICVPVAGLTTFIYSFIIILVCIIMLGTFLGVVSKESIIKNIFHMLLAFGLTIIILILIFGFFTSS
ncbi:MAG: VIT1/CCC1 transporter family protein [Candidatus Lokiarchaeota archaeon]|nr:VIT1/CCC1 transporter family protein [Candidatus Lokiarchaeota archaeon]